MFLEISIAVIVFVSFVVVFVWLFKIYDLLQDKLLNDAKSKMTDALYSLLDGFGNKTQQQRALWAYFRDKLNDIHTSYLEFKEAGRSALSDDKLKKNLLGSAVIDITKNTNFKNEFVNQLDGINKKHYEKFKERMMLDMVNVKRKRDFVTILRANAVRSFTENVKEIFELYKTHHDNTDTIVTTQIDKQTAGFLTFVESVSIDKEKLKEQIMSGKLANALSALVALTHGEEHNEFVLLQSRLSNVAKNERKTGQTDNTERNKITDATIELIESL